MSGGCRGVSQGRGGHSRRALVVSRAVAMALLAVCWAASQSASVLDPRGTQVPASPQGWSPLCVDEQQERAP